MLAALKHIDDNITSKHKVLQCIVLHLQNLYMRYIENQIINRNIEVDTYRVIAQLPTPTLIPTP